MNRLGTAVFAAVEAVVAVGVGIGIALVPLTLLWGFEYGLQIPWAVFWRAAASVWLLGHGVDVTFVLDSAAANATGLPGAGAPIIVTIAALGFALITAWIGARAGRRLAETEHRAIGSVVAIGTVVVLSVAIALSSISVGSRPSLWQSIVLPALWFGAPLLVTAELARRRRSAPADPVTAWVYDRVALIPAAWRAVIGIAFRGGAAVAAVVVAAAGVVVAFLVLGSYAEVITLYERSHAGVVGGLSITVGQLAFLPDFLGWAVSWIVGPGFAIGTGSNVSPIGTTLGPIPGIPIFGALPTSGHSFGLLSVLVPVLGGFLAAAFLRPRLVRALDDANSALLRAVSGAGMGVVAGVVTGLIAWISSGAFGPGRLATVGVSPWPVGALAALEVGVPAILALAAGSDVLRIPDRTTWSLGRERWHDDADELEHEPVPHADTMTTDDDGGFIGALDRAGAGRTTDVHRNVVEDSAAAPTTAESTSTAPERARAAHPVPPPVAPAPEPERVPEPVAGREPVADPEPVTGWEPETEVIAGPDSAPEPGERAGGAPRLPSVLQRAGRSVRDRVREGADIVRDRAEDLRDRVDAVRDRPADRSADPKRPVSPEAAGKGVDEQPGFPWRTEEFEAREAREAELDLPPTAPTNVIPPAVPNDNWDHTDEIPDHELPWWRKPKQ